MGCGGINGLCRKSFPATRAARSSSNSDLGLRLLSSAHRMLNMLAHCSFMQGRVLHSTAGSSAWGASTLESATPRQRFLLRSPVSFWASPCDRESGHRPAAAELWASASDEDINRCPPMNGPHPQASLAPCPAVEPPVNSCRITSAGLWAWASPSLETLEAALLVATAGPRRGKTSRSKCDFTRPRRPPSAFNFTLTGVLPSGS